MAYDIRNQYNSMAEVQCDAPQQVSLTEQVNDQLGGGNNLAEDLLARLYKINERILGDESKLGACPPGYNEGNLAKSQVETVANGMMERLLRQGKNLNIKLNEIESQIRRLEQL